MKSGCQPSTGQIIYCPRCSEKILSPSNGEYILRDRITVFKGDKAFAKCPQCKEMVEIPVSLIS